MSSTTVALVLFWSGSAADPTPIEPEAPHAVTPGPSALFILGVASLPDYVGSDDYVLAPLVVATFPLGRVGVAFEGTALQVDLVPDPAWSAGPLVGFARGRDEDVESDRVAALREIDAALELGAYVGFETSADAAGRDSDPLRATSANARTCAQSGLSLTR